jgi:hypothetical protein
MKGGFDPLLRLRMVDFQSLLQVPQSRTAPVRLEVLTSPQFYTTAAAGLVMQESETRLVISSKKNLAFSFVDDCSERIK